MNNIIIERLDINNITDIKEVTTIMYDWWGKEMGYSFDSVLEVIKSYCGNDVLPIILVAKLSDNIVGTIGLVANDTQLRQDLFPFLTSLYVKEEYRNKNIGTKLVEELLNLARPNFKKIYLMTSSQNYYEKFGFRYIETAKSYIIIPTNKIKENRLYEIDL